MARSGPAVVSVKRDGQGLADGGRDVADVHGAQAGGGPRGAGPTTKVRQAVSRPAAAAVCR